MAKIHEQMIKIMADVGPIAKDRKNTAQGYSFRGVDDVYEALQLVMAKHGVFPVPTVLSAETENRTTAKGTALIYRVLLIRYDFYADDGSSIAATVIGEGMDSGDKAANKAMSVAEKYALIQILLIPTKEAKDPENDSHELEPKPSSEPYSHDNEWQRKLLKIQLIKRKIDPNCWGQVVNSLTGFPLSDLDKVLAKMDV